MTSANEIEQEAMEWLVRLEASGTVGQSDSGEIAVRATRAAFRAWREADPRRHVAYIRLSAAWRKSDQLRQLAVHDTAVDIDLLAPAPMDAPLRPEEEQAPSHFRAFIGWRNVLAAGVALVVLGAAAWWGAGQWAGESYATRVGGFERIVLADGSTVELDTNSRIRVHLTDHRRRVELLQGRAHFKVATDLRRPFEVEAGAATVRALATAFSVRLRDRERMELWVAEGRVAVMSSSPQLSGRSASRSAFPILSAGEAAIIRPAGLTVQTLEMGRPQLARQLSWTQGRLTFDGETLQEAVREFNLYNARKLVIADPQIGSMKVGGSFQATDPQSFVTALERSFGVRVAFADVSQIRLIRVQE